MKIIFWLRNKRNDFHKNKIKKKFARKYFQIQFVCNVLLRSFPFRYYFPVLFGFWSSYSLPFLTRNPNQCDFLLCSKLFNQKPKLTLSSPSLIFNIFTSLSPSCSIHADFNWNYSQIWDVNRSDALKRKKNAFFSLSILIFRKPKSHHKRIEWIYTI